MEAYEDRYRNALDKIAEVIRAMSEDDAPSSDGYDSNNGHVAGKTEVSCTIKQLPARLQVQAAQTAVQINPVNAPLFGTLAEFDTDSPEAPQRLAVSIPKYWGPSPRRLTVSFVARQPADFRARVLLHMNAWTRTCGISFVETQGTGQVRISTGPGGYWSYLGTDILLIPQNRPTMNLEGFTMQTSEREWKRVVRHETGHTLGMPHEHMRQALVARIDRQKAYEYFRRTQNWDRATVDAQVLTPLNEWSILSTPADQDSIMCYQLPGSITRDGRPIRGGADINQIDYAFAGRVYPKFGRDGMFVPAPESTFDSLSVESGEREDWDSSEDVAEPVANAGVARELTLA